MIWIGAGLATQNVPASSAFLMSTLSVGALLLRPFTVIRSRILLSYVTDQISADEHPAGAFGKIIVKADASDIGITAVPTPIASPDAEWYVYQGCDDDFGFITGVGFGRIGRQYEIDAKSMRKVGINENLIGVFENRAAFGANVSVEGRTLIKLH